MAKWRRGGGGRRRWVIEYVPVSDTPQQYTTTNGGEQRVRFVCEVIHDGEAGAVSQRLGVGCGDGLAAPAGVEPCAAVVLEADAAPERAADAEAGESIVDG